MSETRPEYLTEAQIGAITGFGYVAVRRILREKVKPCFSFSRSKGVSRVYAASRFEEIYTVLCDSLMPIDAETRAAMIKAIQAPSVPDARSGSKALFEAIQAPPASPPPSS